MKPVYLLFLTLLPAAGTAQPVLSLKEAIRQALTAHESVRIDELKVQSAAVTAGQALNNRLPTVKLTGRFTHQSEVDPFRIPLDTPMGPIDKELVGSIQDAGAFRLTLSQPLFAGFKLQSAQKAADWNERAAGMDLETRKTELALAVTRSFGQVILAEKQLEVTRKLAETLAKRFTDAEAGFASGLLTEPDVLTIRVKQTETQAELIYAEEKVRLARLNLGQWIGREGPVTDSVKTATGEPDLAGTARRPETESLVLREKAAGELKTAARGDWFPSVAFQANYDYANPNSRYFPPENVWNKSWDVSLLISFDVWTWNTRSLQSQQAEITLNQVQLQKSLLDKSIRIEQESAAASVQRAEKMVSVMELLVSQTRKKADQLGNQFRAGMATPADVMEGDTAAAQAELQLEGARVSLMAERMAKAKADGRLAL
ncbi:MAG: TolC family protein [Bacteroidetes bacterium]|nr:TolC family protein [Bacteroidota bacterium]